MEVTMRAFILKPKQIPQQQLQAAQMLGISVPTVDSTEANSLTEAIEAFTMDADTIGISVLFDADDADTKDETIGFLKDFASANNFAFKEVSADKIRLVKQRRIVTSTEEIQSLRAKFITT